MLPRNEMDSSLDSTSEPLRRGRPAAYWVVASWTTLALVSSIACSSSSSTNGAASSSSAASSLSSAERAAGASPIPSAVIRATMNPKGLPDYTGPVGTVVGKITVKGDPAPMVPTGKIPAQCAEARAMYERLFRAGPDGALADTVVGVTGFNGYVPEKNEAVKVRIHGCSFSSRALAVTFGQRIEVENGDQVAYIPHLDGARAPALLVSVPKAPPVALYAREPGVFRLIDDMKHDWMVADVFVFKFATHDVSKEDGMYRIEGIPVGKAMVSARHPRIKTSLDREVEIKAGETLTVDFEIPFDCEEDTPAAEAAAASASALRAPHRRQLCGAQACSSTGIENLLSTRLCAS
ncbi:MAG: carboxypeptidase-like regulatory domain-containing protein [Polyangiaceae bacterium]